MGRVGPVLDTPPGHDSPATEKAAGFGRPIDDPELQKMTAEGTGVFGEAVAMVLAHDAATAQEAALLVRVSLQAVPAWGAVDPDASVVHQVAHTHG